MRAEVFWTPMLCLSLYFKTHRQAYYETLGKVRANGDWESWLEFFAEAVIATAAQAVEMSQRVLALFKDDCARLARLGRAAESTEKVHRAMMERPIATAGWLVENTKLTPATVNKSLEHLRLLGIVQETSGQKRNRLFSYVRYIEILNEGARPHCLSKPGVRRKGGGLGCGQAPHYSFPISVLSLNRLENSCHKCHDGNELENNFGDKIVFGTVLPHGLVTALSRLGFRKNLRR